MGKVVGTGREDKTNPGLTEKHFERFFSDPLYLLYKNHLYNYLLRRFVILRNFRPRSPQRILELGCGISPMLGESWGAIRTDVSWRALAYLSRCSKQSESARRATACDATSLPFATGSVKSVICSEVLEHIEEDGAVLDEIARVLESGGELILTLPMRPELFGFDDSFVGHYRRYELGRLTEILSARNFGEFQHQSILGGLEKSFMEGVTRLFSFMKRDEHRGSEQPPLIGVRILGWLFFPFYLLVNYLLAFLVYIQARFTSPNRAVTLFLRCKKQR